MTSDRANEQMAASSTEAEAIKPSTGTMRLARWLSLFLFAAVAVLIGVYLYQNHEVFVEFTRVPVYFWALPGALFFGTLLAKGLTFDVLARVYGVRISLRDSIALTTWGLLANFALPGNTALAFRTVYLHRVHGLNYRQFLPISAAAFICATGLYCVWAGIAALIVGGPWSPTVKTLAVPLIGLGATLIVALQIPYRRFARLGGLAEKLLDGWRRLVSSRSLFGCWFGLELGRAALEVLLFFSIVRFLNIDLSLSQTAVMVLVKECSLVLRITPGAFGVAEGVLAFLALTFGVSPVQVVFAGLIYRCLELICLLAALVVFARRLIGQFNSVSGNVHTTAR